MARINPSLQKLTTSYLFNCIQKEKEKHPEKDWINLGIGDATESLSPTVARAISQASKELTYRATHRGYPPSQGYLFLRETICEKEYAHLRFSPEEIFIGNGAKGDLVNVQDLFSPHCRVALPDPTYPVYFESNFINGKSKFLYLSANEENNWTITPPKESCDIVYLCSPNNPTGAVFTHEDLERWVAYAKKAKAFLIYDAAYKAFISSSDLPKSIFEVDGAKDIAIEISSFSKTAGFTNLRCSYVTIAKSCPLYALWKRRIETTFGGVPYPIQKGAEAVFSFEGKKEIQKTLSTYQSHAKRLREGLIKNHIQVASGPHSPYLWCKNFHGMDSWELFYYLLENYDLVVVPGRGFGPSGEGFFRISSFANSLIVTRALAVFDQLEKKPSIL